MSLRGLRWVTVLAPLFFLGFIEFVRYTLPFQILRSWPFSLALLALFAVTILLFSRMVLDHVETVQQRLVAQNATLTQLEENARLQAAKLRGLHQASLALVEDLSLDAVLQRVVDLAKGLSQARYGALGVFDDDGNITRFITSGLTNDERVRIGELPKGLGLLGELHKLDNPTLVRDISLHHSAVGFPLGHPRMTSFLGVPLHFKGRLLGNLYLTDKQGAPEFSESDSAIVELFAAVAAVAIENARLHEQVQHLAIEEERQRIAREMHDGLAQILAYVNVKAGAARRLLSLGRAEQAAQELQQLERAAQDVYIEVREAILGLRTMTQGTQGLPVVLQQYLDRFSDLTGVPVDLEFTCDVADLALSPEAEVQLIRVIQEALSNVRKHARASRTVVRIGVDERCTTLEVMDDGQGFSTDRPAFGQGPHFGLQTMRERVESLDGNFTVSSVVGRGTHITVRLPRSLRENG